MWVAIIIGVVVILVVVFIYNSLIAKKNQVTNVFGTIDALLKKRYDLLPKLISTVKAYMEHEKSLLTEITEMRAKAVSGQLSDDEQVDLDNKLSKMLGGIMVAVENYPDLKASQNFLELQRELRDTEDKIQAARRFYNSNVRDLSIKIEAFPSNMVAKIFNFKKMTLFEIKEAAAREVPKVNF